MGSNTFQWYFLTSSQVHWKDIESCVQFLSTELPDIKIDNSYLFEEIRKLNIYLNSKKLVEWEK